LASHGHRAASVLVPAQNQKQQVEIDKVNIRRVIMPALLGLAITSPTRTLIAQKAGTTELGGFAQLEVLDDAFQTSSTGFGAGGRFGVYLSPRWELEADASFTRAEPIANRGGNPKVQTGDHVQFNYYVGRLNYNLPWGGRPGNAIVLGAGVGADRVDSHTDLVIAPQIGLRAMFSRVVGARFDVGGVFSPNPASGTFKYPTVVGGENQGAAYLSNIQARAGLSFLFGNTTKFVAPAPVVAQAPPASAPAPAPAPVPTVNQDSIDRANRLRDSLAAAERALAEARSLLNAPVYFDFDKSEIRTDAKSALDAKLPLLKANSAMKIRIEGNTDSRGSNEYNMALGLRRANAAKRYLVSQGLDAARFDVVSYGEERPVDQGTTEEAYQKNRRDDFVITVGSDNIQVQR
jgi:peptidoglycan-associated lipoprotein